MESTQRCSRISHSQSHAHLAPGSLRGMGEPLVRAHDVSVHVLPRRHEVALCALAAPAPLFLSPRADGGTVNG